MSKVLIPVDSSDSARRALQHAISLTKQNPSIELHIVNAHELPIIYGEIAVYLPKEKARELQRRHSEDILKPAAELARAAGAKFTTEILVGDVASASTPLMSRVRGAGCDSKNHAPCTARTGNTLSNSPSTTPYTSPTHVSASRS